ncbi:hypothetical protein DFH11DRAFT_1679529 [Phellopilus nigrolimitatus]|nr:hypothetical protein DFH11DRAFT_1679529 [Phellopilus nigrolimitatus]
MTSSPPARFFNEDALKKRIEVTVAITLDELEHRDDPLQVAATILSQVVHQSQLYLDPTSSVRLDSTLSSPRQCRKWLTQHEKVHDLILKCYQEELGYRAVCKHPDLYLPVTHPSQSSLTWSSQESQDNLFNKKRVTATLESELSNIERKLRNLVCEKTMPPLWSYPQSDAVFAEHILALKIPNLREEPSLLLHGLGNPSPDFETRVSDIFRPSGQHSFVCNTSGSGKTRILLEGLCRHWGLYFVCSQSTDHVGSSDLPETIRENGAIASTHDWSGELPSPEDSTFSYRKATNERIARRRLSQVLLARLLLFDRFLRIAYEHKIGRTSKAKWLWTLIQVDPLILEGDICKKLTGILHSASMEFLSYEIAIMQSQIAAHDRDDATLDNLFYVLDEAQVASCLHEKAFISSNDRKMRPILREIIASFQAITSNAKFVVSGTGLSVDVVSEAVASAVMKTDTGFKSVFPSGDFGSDDGTKQLEYIRRYLPSKFLSSPSGEDLIRRLAFWLRGRYRFTASYLVELLKNGLRSPHKLLNKIIFLASSYKPSDARPDIINAEPDYTSRLSMHYFNVSRLDDETLTDEINFVLFSYMLRGTFIPTSQRLVEIGFSRYMNGVQESICINEHLVILVLATWMEGKEKYSMGRFLCRELRNKSSQPMGFENTIMHYLASAFGVNGTPLTDIFDFVGLIPPWANQRVQLVAFTSVGGRYTFSPISLMDGVVPSSRIVIHARDADMVLDLIKNAQNIPFLIPDNHMGPDGLFVLRREDGTIMWAAIQDKCQPSSETNLAKSVVEDAIRTITPKEFYGGDSAWSERLNYKKPRDLVNQLMCAIPSKDGEASNPAKPTYNLLRIVAAYPAKAGLDNDPLKEDHVFPLAILRNDRLLKYDKTSYLPVIQELTEHIAQQKAGKRKRWNESSKEDSRDHVQELVEAARSVRKKRAHGHEI